MAHVKAFREDIRLVAAACRVELEAVVGTLDALALLCGAHERAHRQRRAAVRAGVRNSGDLVRTRTPEHVSLVVHLA